jgi:hypothetical protein
MKNLNHEIIEYQNEIKNSIELYHRMSKPFIDRLGYLYSLKLTKYQLNLKTNEFIRIDEPDTYEETQLKIQLEYIRNTYLLRYEK